MLKTEKQAFGCILQTPTLNTINLHDINTNLQSSLGLKLLRCEKGGLDARCGWSLYSKWSGLQYTPKPLQLHHARHTMLFLSMPLRRSVCPTGARPNLLYRKFKGCWLEKRYSRLILHFVPRPFVVFSELWLPRCRRCGQSRSKWGCWSPGG